MDILNIIEAGVCGVIAWRCLEKLSESNKLHFEEVLSISKALDNNTKAIERLCDRFDRMEGEIDGDK